MNDPAFLRGKRILITSYSYALFGGAELNAVELADQLVKFGMVPTFFSYDISGPLKKHIEQAFDTQVLTDKVHRLAENETDEAMGITSLDINDYDYIWVGGNTIPISIIRQINTAKKLPKFIFIHMSQLVAFPLDAPLMPYFEQSLASEVLSISSRTTSDNIYRILPKTTSISTWPNPVPEEFKNVSRRVGTLKRVAIISSSHPGEEILQASEILKKQGLGVELIGRFNNNVKVVDADFYKEYDLIVGIGKNAKYSLVSGVPIYIYGRFGGGGYITEENIDLNDNNNFSGRGFTKKSADTIADEIVSGYHDALKFHEKHRENFIKEHSLDNTARELFTKLEHQKNTTIKFDEQYISWLISMQINLMQRIQSAASYRVAKDRTQKLALEIDKFKKESILLRNDISKRKKEAHDLRNSRSWRLTKPLRVIGHLLRRTRKKSNEYGL